MSGKYNLLLYYTYRSTIVETLFDRFGGYYSFWSNIPEPGESKIITNPSIVGLSPKYRFIMEEHSPA
jgi:hypothetical protein